MRFKTIISNLLICTLFVSSCKHEKKEAAWITHPVKNEDANLWIAFKIEFESNKKQNKVFTRIACDSKYWMWINDSLIVFEGGLKRGPNPRDTYIDTLNIAPFLKKGNNHISILLWHFGKDGFSHKNSGTAGLFFEAEGKNMQLVSDSCWKVKIHPAFENTKWPHPNYRLPESNIRFDARKDMPDWFLSSYPYEDWDNAFEVGQEGASTWGNLIDRPIPQWYNSGLLTYESIKDTIIKDTRIIHAYLPKNITITPYLKINADAGQIIDIRTDNYKGGGEFNMRTEYVTKEGIQSFETFGYLNGHYVIYKLPKEIDIIDLKYRETKYDAELIGSFNCNDQFYNILYTKALNTLNVNMRDAIQDPDRERAQWWGDVVILMGEIFYTLDENGVDAIKKAMYNLVDWQKEDASLYSPVPEGKWKAELPTQMLASVGKYGFWTYFEYTGDTAMIEYVYPSVKKYMNLWQLNDEGLVKQRKGGWTWLDWGQKIDSALVYNTWYYMALNSAANMANLLNDDLYYELCLGKSDSIKNAFNTLLWDGTSYKSPDYAHGYDDRGNGLAVVAGLADSSKFTSITNTLKKYANASPYTEKYILEALFLMGQEELALNRMKDRFSNMVKSELTTLWEGWGIGSEGYGGGTYNHGWSGGGLTLLAQYVCGVSPKEPGFKKIRISPQLGLLNEAHSTIPIQGDSIRLDLYRYDNKLKLEVLNTSGNPVVFSLPDQNGKRCKELSINEIHIIKKGVIYPDSKFKIKGFKNGRFIFEDSGTQYLKIVLNY